MGDLTVPKRRVPLKVTLEGGLLREVVVFLAEGYPGHEGGERLSDLLNGEANFIPALEASRTMTFLNRTAVMIAEAADDAERTGWEELTIPTEHAVEVTLGDGRTLLGTVDYVLPPDHSRLVDYLNLPTHFLTLHLETRVLLVSKRHVSRVVLVDP